MDLVAVSAVLVIVLAVIGVFRGLDVRLVLLFAAFALGALAGDLAPILRTFLSTFSNEKFVVPICSAMGFAYVLRFTGCDQHLIRLLLEPVRRFRFLIIPGVVLVGFVVNIPVISQTSTAVCLGTVVVPLMRAAGFSPLAIGSTLLLGTSIGGELLNPGAPELLTISNRTGIPTTEMQSSVLPLILPALLTATLVFWIITIYGERNSQPEVETDEKTRMPDVFDTKLNLFKAFVPLVPLFVLFFSGPPLNLFEIPLHWLIDVSKEKAAAASSRFVALAMMVGVLTAALASPRQAKGCVKAFFEGAGFGFTIVVSIIVTANCFGTGIREVGLAEHLQALIADNPDWLQPLAGIVPMGFGFVSGSGMASTQSLYGFFHDASVGIGSDPASLETGSMVAVGSALGRTMSPVAAVTLMCATLTGAKPFALVKRVAIPLCAGMAVVLALRLANVV